MVRFKAQGTQRRFPSKYNGNQGYAEYFCTFTSLEIHSKSDPKRRYKNLFMFGHPVENHGGRLLGLFLPMPLKTESIRP